MDNENRSERNSSFRESVVDPVGISRNERIPGLLVKGGGKYAGGLRKMSIRFEKGIFDRGA
jgi:hypothetical protein